MGKGYSGLFQAAKIERREPDFYTGNNGKTMLAAHKRSIGVNRRGRLLAKAKTPKLKDAINQLYRPGFFLGEGGTGLGKTASLPRKKPKIM